MDTTRLSPSTKIDFPLRIFQRIVPYTGKEYFAGGICDGKAAIDSFVREIKPSLSN
jgi:hypothetical protein